MTAPKTFRIFLSSPGDVKPQRDIVEKVLGEIFSEEKFVQVVELARWDNDEGKRITFNAGKNAQAQVDNKLGLSSEYDLVIVLFWSRLGTKTEIDGKEYESGTAYEFELALEAAQKNGSPKIWLYYFTDEPPANLDDSKLTKKTEQRKRLQSYKEEKIDEENLAYNTCTLEKFEPLIKDALKEELIQRSIEASRNFRESISVDADHSVRLHIGTLISDYDREVNREIPTNDTKD